MLCAIDPRSLPIQMIRFPRVKWLVTGVSFILVMTGCQPPAGDDGPAADTPAAPDATPSMLEWPTHGGTYHEQRFGVSSEITPDTISRLGLAWYADFDTHRGQESTPLMVDGVVYVTTAWSKVYAYDAVTEKWTPLVGPFGSLSKV